MQQQLWAEAHSPLCGCGACGSCGRHARDLRGTAMATAGGQGARSELQALQGHPSCCPPNKHPPVVPSSSLLLLELLLLLLLPFLFRRSSRRSSRSALRSCSLSPTVIWPCSTAGTRGGSQQAQGEAVRRHHHGRLHCCQCGSAAGWRVHALHTRLNPPPWFCCLAAQAARAQLLAAVADGLALHPPEHAWHHGWPRCLLTWQDDSSSAQAA
jgi:hypothetical protein